MAAKTIFVIGATGPLGILFCQEALKRGHALHIFARNAGKLPKDVSEHERVKVFEGQLTDADLLGSAVRGCDIVVSALGPSMTFAGLTVPPGTFTTPLRTIMAAMRAHRIRRILVMGTPSIRIPEDNFPFTTKAAIGLFSIFAKQAYSEVVAVGKMLDDEAGDLDWTMYRIGGLSDADGVTKAVATIGEGEWNMNTFRGGLVGWLMELVEKAEEKEEWIRKKPAIFSV